MRKWQLGVGTREATIPTRSLFMYPGYRSVVVEAAITVDTRELSCVTEGCAILSRSSQILFMAVLSSTTVQSQNSMRRLSVSTLLYGCTTTSLLSWAELGKTEYVWMSFLGKWSDSSSRR